jgi:hypothetical protein
MDSLVVSIMGPKSLGEAWEKIFSRRRYGHPRRPHHKRTRSSGEQREITVKAAEPEKAAPWPFAQVSAQAGLK